MGVLRAVGEGRVALRLGAGTIYERERHVLS
jgi:hypothetical protein